MGCLFGKEKDNEEELSYRIEALEKQIYILNDEIAKLSVNSNSNYIDPEFDYYKSMPDNQPIEL